MLQSATPTCAVAPDAGTPRNRSNVAPRDGGRHVICHNTNERSLHKRLRDLIVQACEADDVDLISQALTLGSTEQVTRLAFPRAFSRNAPKVLDYLLTHGSDIKDIAGTATSEPHTSPWQLTNAHSPNLLYKSFLATAGTSINGIVTNHSYGRLLTTEMLWPGV
jgi:hypothetical protein